MIGAALICCLALAPAAMAKIEFSGMVTNDVYYHEQSGEMEEGGRLQGAAATRDGFSTININMPQATNRFYVRYHNDEGNLWGEIQMREGGLNDANVAGGKNADIWETMFLDYKLNDMVHFRLGRQPQSFSTMAPGADGIGHASRFTLLVGYGNVHGGSSRDAVKAYIKFNDMVRMEIMAIDPDTATDEAALTGMAVAPGEAIREENTIPRFDLSIPITIGNFYFEPAATWLKQNYDGIAAGYEDNLDIWGLSLGAKAGFGPVTILAEINYGQNLGVGNYTGAPLAVPYAYASGNHGAAVDSIEDTDVWAGWIQVNFDFGPATLQMAFGVEDTSNDGSPIVANDSLDRTRYGYAVSLPITVTKGFTVMPGVCYHDADSSGHANAATNLSTDYGDEILVGVQFQLKF
jgi:hypothetical protein